MQAQLPNDSSHRHRHYAAKRNRLESPVEGTVARYHLGQDRPVLADAESLLKLGSRHWKGGGQLVHREALPGWNSRDQPLIVADLLVGRR